MHSKWIYDHARNSFDLVCSDETLLTYVEQAGNGQWRWNGREFPTASMAKAQAIQGIKNEMIGEYAKEKLAMYKLKIG